MIDDELVGTTITNEHGTVVVDDGRTAMPCPECGKQVIFCSGWRIGRHGGRFKGLYLKCSDRKRCGWKSYDGKRMPLPKKINIVTKAAGILKAEPSLPKEPRDVSESKGDISKTCEEASTLSVETYIPCGAPATRRILSERDKKTYSMCAACADHNVWNRGCEDVGSVQ